MLESSAAGVQAATSAPKITALVARVCRLICWRRVASGENPKRTLRAAAAKPSLLRAAWRRCGRPARSGAGCSTSP